MFKVLIMDFDGVVIESNGIKNEAFEQVFARFPEHTQAMMDFHHTHVSLSRYVKFEHVLELMGRTGDIDLLADIAGDFSRRVLEGMLTVPLVEGAEDFLHYAKKRVPIYLASVTPDKELELILEQRGLAHWFRAVYGCPPWTKPDAIFDVLAREGVQPDDALLIGDSAGDQHAAAITGIRFLGRDSGLRFNQPIPMIFPDLHQIKQHMEHILP